MLAGTVVLLSGAPVVVATAATPRAGAEHQVREHVVLKVVKRHGTTKFEHAGKASGTVAGAVRSKITLAHAVVIRGTVTIATSKGRLRLKIDGRARSLELRTKFNGSATIEGGTGRYAHARGSGKFSGVVNRSTWAATIDASGAYTD